MKDQTPQQEDSNENNTRNTRNINLENINTSLWGGKMIITPIKEDSMTGPPENADSPKKKNKNGEADKMKDNGEQDLFYLSKFSEKLNLNVKEEENSVRIYRKLRDIIAKRSRLSNRVVSDIKLLNTCSIYLATRVIFDDKKEFSIKRINKIGIPLDDIQQVDDMRTRFSDFYKHITYVINLLDVPNNELMKDLQKVQKSLIILKNVYESMQDYMLTYFDRSHIDEVMEMAWMLLIVVLKGEIIDFEETFFRMVELVVIIFKNTPNEWLLPDNTVMAVSTHFKYDVPEHMRGTVVREIEELELKQPIMINFNENMRKLHKTYDTMYATLSEESTNMFDARIFFKQIVLVGTTNILTDAGVFQMNLMDYSSSAQQNILFSPLSKQNEVMIGIPISTLDATLHSMYSIYEAIKDEDPTPSGRIETIFKESKVDLNVHDLEPLIMELDFSPKLDKETIVARKDIIRKLYWKTLFDILSSESKRLQSSVHTKLLENIKFRNVLFVCCVEIVFFGFNIGHTMSFSSILKKFNVSSLDLIKAIEFVIINSRWMTSPFKRRLSYLENACLEKGAWQDKTSELWLKESKDPSDRTYQPGFMTPKQEKRKRSYNANTSVEKKPSLNFFFHKVSRMVSRRVYDLCSYFNVISKEQSQKIFNLVIHLLHEKRHLMRGRHIDHLIMCSMYVICNKVAQLAITFSDIIHHYRYICATGRHLTQNVIDDTLFKVKIYTGKEEGDIVSFYNEVFIQDVKTFVFENLDMKTPPSSPGTAKGIPTYEMDNLVSPARRRVANSVFLSPLPASRRKEIETPRSKVLLSFEGSSIQHAGGQPLMHSPQHFYSRKRDRPRFNATMNVEEDAGSYKNQVTKTPDGKTVMRRRRLPQFESQQ